MATNWTEKEYQQEVQRRQQRHQPDAAMAPQVQIKARGRIRPPKGMNRTEVAYSAHLEVEKRIGAVLWYRFEGVTLKLGDDCRFTPDFAVMVDTGLLEFHDTKAVHRGKVKPHIEDDAAVKLRVAAGMFPFTFRAVWPEGDGWGSKEF